MMKAIKRMLLAVVMIISTAAAAQTTIAGGEYWIDGTIDARQALSSGASINISALQPGLHTLTVRVKDSNGLWSNQVARIFFVSPTGRTDATSVTACEYWIDGVKKSEYTTLNSQVIDISSLKPGLHKVLVRVKDNLGIWSNQISRTFFVTPGTQTDATTITKREFWLDGDIIHRQTIDDTPAVIDISTLDAGLHMLTMRVQDDKGIWSNQIARSFYVAPLPAPTATLTKYMYWIDGDQEHAVTGKLTENEGELTFDLGELAEGEHTLSWCVKDSKDAWSNIVTETFVVGKTTLEKDEDGYYLVGTVVDWKLLAKMVNNGQTQVNVRMTADIDLGDDQTMVGSYAQRYSGTFDGQGHTLTINYDTKDMTNDDGQGYLGAAPFRDVEGATIRNLHTKGSITADKIGATGLIGWTYGTNTIEQCWSEVDITGTNSIADTFAGFVFRQDGTLLTINDCLYTGKIATVRKTSNAGFVGHQVAGATNINNSLVVLAEGSDESQSSYYTFARNWGNSTPVNISNSYYLRPWGALQGTATTAEQLADGTTTRALRNSRDERVWAQDWKTKRPMLKLFLATDESIIKGDANGDHEVNIKDAVSVVNYLFGSPSENFVPEAADINEDDCITITDAVGIVNISLGDH